MEFQGFAHASERLKPFYPTNTPSSSTQSRVQQLGSVVQIRMYSASPPNGYRGSPGQADQCLAESPTHSSIQQDHPSGHNSQLYGKVGEPDEDGKFQEHQDECHAPLGNKKPFLSLAESYTMYEDVPALQFSDGRGAPAQFRRPAYECRPADRAVPDKVQGIYNDISLPLSSPGWNPGLKSLKIPNEQ